MLGDWEHLAEDTSSQPTELILTRVADYDVLRVIGRGGMGVVCRARDRLLGREVALKLMHSGVLASEEELRRFRTEAEAVARLRHPNLVAIYEAGDSDGQAFYTMTLAEGGTLAQRIAEGPLPSREAATLVECLAHAVHHAHMRGILHRDLKPANIIFDSDGNPLVSDFGLARITADDTMTRTGALLGTPAYLSPEVAGGSAPHTTSSDVYALGVILYECLTGVPPFEHESPLVLLKMITEKETPPLATRVKGIDNDLEAVTFRALEKDPARRYSSAEALAEDLSRWLRHEPVTARHPPMSERFWRWAQRNQSRAVLYTMTAVSLLILVVTSALMNVLLANAQGTTSEAMHKSEMRRAQLLRDVAARRFEDNVALDRAQAQLREAALIGTGLPLQDNAIGLRLRVLARLERLAIEPWPHWQGKDLQRVWFDNDSRLFLQTADATMQFTATGITKIEQPLTPPEDTQPATPTLTIDAQQRVHVWGKDRDAKELTDPLAHPARVQLTVVSADERYLATIADDGNLRVWELLTGLAVTPPIKLAEPANHIAWDIGRHQLAVWNERELTLYNW